ncbi:GHKL domain-containing protein [Endozoicomonas sp. G2_1]|uniref:ATP-binding protein n=1 Tax=Endozoicomonas sp. G2_1 TaxID=2821091 RepID=UPI001ADCCDF1|nr:GHKL domain-containing protein [Endozoicomonas sp. G2_1]
MNTNQSANQTSNASKHSAGQFFSRCYQVFTASLKARLLTSAIFVVLIVLPIIGITLNQAFEAQLKNAIKKELTAYSYSILAVAEVDANQLLMPEQLLENQFNVIQSGLYALFSDYQANNKLDLNGESKASEGVVWRSSSLLGLELPEQLAQPKLAENSFALVELDNQAHFIFSITINFADNLQDLPLTLHIIRSQQEYLASLQEFKQTLWLWLAVLMLLLLVSQVLWLLWTLKPLKVLKQELADVEQGRTDELKAQYPSELQQVTGQVNTLLATEQSQRKRYRNALSDLAHSLKTPLAVIQSQSDLSTNAKEQLSTINQMIEHQLKRAQSAGQSSWHLGTEIAPVLTKLANTFKKLHATSAKQLLTELGDGLIFKGDEADLMEILGNLIDNAFKAANSQVNVSIFIKQRYLEIHVEDDGPGIDQDQKTLILERGTRVDTYKQGHGIGLAIVRDLVDSYQGELDIARSSLGGAHFMLTFPNY